MRFCTVSKNDVTYGYPHNISQFLRKNAKEYCSSTIKLYKIVSTRNETLPSSDNNLIYYNTTYILVKYIVHLLKLLDEIKFRTVSENNNYL